MKKNLLTLVSVCLFSNFIFAQVDSIQQSVINTTGGGSSIDITSVLIGLVVGAAIGYFAGSRKSSK
jgi:hypothetical protein